MHQLVALFPPLFVLRVEGGSCYLQTFHLCTEQEHPGMGCPDMPGMAEQSTKDFLTEEDLDALSQEIQK